LFGFDDFCFWGGFDFGRPGRFVVLFARPFADGLGASASGGIFLYSLQAGGQRKAALVLCQQLYNVPDFTAGESG